MVGTLGAHDGRPAIVEPGRGAVSYVDLDRLAEAVAGKWRSLGIPPGARVGLYMRRSTDTIAAMLGTLRAGCAYVPVDPYAPPDRVAAIHADCRVHAALVEDAFAVPYKDALARAGVEDVAVHSLGPLGLGHAIETWTASRNEGAVVPRRDLEGRTDLACLLYTSGTTGRPKGWMMSREAIAVLARWSHRLFAPAGDVFANHTQFSFGMSIFDIYSSLGCGARLVLIPDEIRQHAALVADVLARERVSIWFTGTAILSMMGQLPDLASRDLSALRAVIFAGAVFPLRQLNDLRSRLTHPRYFHFYGSTEANVASYHEIPNGVPLDDRPPIGRVCEHYESRIVGEDGAPVAPGCSGELQLRGAGLGTGYWGQPTSQAPGGPNADAAWFSTGDLVMPLPTGDLRYAGRIGRMVKLRGYRVEPGEIEARLYQHPSIQEVGVVAAETDAELQLVAHVSTITGDRLPVVELREFCAVILPAYMIPARFVFHTSLPRTSSGKIDLQALGAISGVTREQKQVSC